MFGGNISYYIIMKYVWRRLGSKLKIEIDHDGVKWQFSKKKLGPSRGPTSQPIKYSYLCKCDITW